jgi:hypothetical protein
LGTHPTFDDSIQEYMHWHYRLNHASFLTMLHRAKQKAPTTGHLIYLKKDGKTSPQTTTLHCLQDVQKTMETKTRKGKRA